jgi:pantoate--beta-alanine ligase
MKTIGQNRAGTHPLERTAPDLIKKIDEVRSRVLDCRRLGLMTSLVPTMGALHAGHGALIERARRESDVVFVTIFVNPIQFDRPDDYAKYTLNLQADIAFCAARGVDFVFAPEVKEMYPSPPDTFVEVPRVSERLCGEFRPGHFRGVATVVAKLFNIVPADAAYFGEKDAQQLAVIRRMVADLNIPIAIVPVPTVREADGLALSSRNQRLSPAERRVAPLLYQALEAARERIASGCRDAAEVKEAGLALLRAEPQIRVEYFDVADAEEMQPVEQIAGPVRVAAAVWLGATRLIDNLRGDNVPA